MGNFNGKQKIQFCQRLGKNWQELADYFAISETDRNRFAPGDEARGLWTWLELRERLNELPEALRYIGREDIAVGVLADHETTRDPEKPILYSKSPFPGLRAFTEDEAAIFFGRTAEINALLEIVRNKRSWP